MNAKTAFLACVCIPIAFVAGCHSSGSGPTNVQTPSASAGTLHGLAVAGAPIFGTVNVKGANGATASSTIELDGSFSLDVLALEAPYILFAEGHVNGKSIRTFSAALEDGVINITPVTDFILRNASNNLLDWAYDNWTFTQTSESALKGAESNARTLLGPVLSAAGVPNDFDLLTTPFAADSTGIDAALDVIEFAYDGGIATVTNRITGSSFMDDTSVSGDSEGFSPAETLATENGLADAVAINEFLDTLEDLLRVTPTVEEFTGWLNDNLAEDFLADGQTKDVFRDDWIAEGVEGDGNTNLSATILAPLDVAGTAYTKGYWINVSFVFSDEQGADRDAVVFDGADWLWYGDRRWVEFNTNAFAGYTDANDTFSTGLELYLEDSFSYAYDHGVRSAVVSGPGLPMSGVLLEHQFPVPSFAQYSGGGLVYIMSNDAEIAAIPDNAEYTYQLCSQTADTLNTDGNDTCTVLDASSEISMKPPVPNSALDISKFAAITNPNSTNLANLSFGSLIEVSWTKPPQTGSTELSMHWIAAGQSYNVADEEVWGEETSGTLDTIGLPAPDTGWANIFLRVTDFYGRDFHRTVQFSN